MYYICSKISYFSQYLPVVFSFYGVIFTFNFLSFYFDTLFKVSLFLDNFSKSWPVAPTLLTELCNPTLFRVMLPFLNTKFHTGSGKDVATQEQVYDASPFPSQKPTNTTWLTFNCLCHTLFQALDMHYFINLRQ